MMPELAEYVAERLRSLPKADREEELAIITAQAQIDAVTGEEARLAEEKAVLAKFGKVVPTKLK